MAIVLSLGLIAVGLAWPRTSLINSLIVLWLAVYGIPYVVVSTYFRRVIHASASDVVERRKSARHSGDQPVIPDPPSESDPPSSDVEIRPIE
jgi:hypothetical protein